MQWIARVGVFVVAALLGFGATQLGARPISDAHASSPPCLGIYDDTQVWTTSTIEATGLAAQGSWGPMNVQHRFIFLYDATSEGTWYRFELGDELVEPGEDAQR